jgi:acylphosphatase
MTIARRFVVQGRVQGVGYRYFAINAANDCGVLGTVKNLPDGSVEVIAEGSRDAVFRFRVELERGPSYGRVTAVHESELPPTGRYRRFDVVF